MKKNQLGVSTILVLILISTLLLSLTGAWRAASLAVEGAILAQRAVFNRYLAESLLVYGLKKLKKNELDLSKKTATLSLYEGSWIDKLGKLKLEYQTEKESKVGKMQAELFEPSNPVHAIVTFELEFSLSPDHTLLISSWH